MIYSSLRVGLKLTKAAILVASCSTATIAQAQNFGSSELRCLLQPFKQTALSTPGREIVSERLVELGDTVEVDELLMRFFSGGLFARIDRARAELELAELTDARAVLLSSVMTAAELEIIQTEVLLRRADLDELLQDSARYDLKAPHPGIIAEVSVDVGEVVDDGPALRLVSIDRLRAEFDLPISFLDQLYVGDSVMVLNEAKGVREGIVTFVDPLVDVASRSFRMFVVIENPQTDWIAGTFCDLLVSDS